jgi:hypothetical protein
MAIPLTDITAGTLEGKGAFDVLMRAAKVHLDEEFRKNRFKTDEYADIYLGTMTQVLQQSMQFVLMQAKADKEVALIEAQINHTNTQKDLVFQQKVNLITENANLVLQGDKLAAEKTLLAQQNVKMLEEIQLLQQQQVNLALDAANIPKQGQMLDAQKAKVDTDTAVSAQQVINLQSDKLVKDAQATQITKQTEKHDTEIAVLAQKVKTEQAQILDTVDGNAVTGVLGKQKALYTAQTDGFQRDAEQKAAKMFFDVWSVQRTTDEGISPAGAGLADTEISKVAQKLKSGIGVV